MAMTEREQAANARPSTTATGKNDAQRRTREMQLSNWNRLVSGTLAVIVALATGNIGIAFAQETPAPPPPASLSARGGVLAKTGRYQFEVFFYKSGVRVFPRDAAERLVTVAALSGTAAFAVPGAPKPLVYPLRAGTPGNAPASSSIDLALDLSKLPASGTTVTFQFNGLADPNEPSASFTVPFILAPSTPEAAPRRIVPATLSITRSTPADQPAINAQRVCKVSGESLGSMGAPIKVTRGDRAIFLCCQGCVKRVQANPDQYLGTR
jgi:hypothetical protein